MVPFGGLFGNNLDEKTVKMVEIAGWYITDEEAEAIEDGFAEKGEALGEAGEVEARREIVLTNTYTKDGQSSMVVYNFTDGKYYVVSSDFTDTYMADDAFRRLGAPVSSKKKMDISGSTTAGKIKDGKYTAQLFEKGVILLDGGEVKMYVGAVEKVKGGAIIHPLIDDQDLMVKRDGKMDKMGNVDGEMHPLKEVILTRTNKGFTLYANYSSACVYLELGKDYSVKRQLISAAKNYVVTEEGGYAATILPIECISVDDMVKDGSDPVDPEAFAYYQQNKPRADADDLVKKFTDAYTELYKEGYVAGYRCSKIKMWTYMVLDMRFGDGTTGFDEAGTNGRERMTCLVYNPDKDTVYPVSDTFFSIWKEDGDTGRNTLGYPETKIMKNTDIGGTTYDLSQRYKNGYICINDNGDWFILDRQYNRLAFSETGASDKDDKPPVSEEPEENNTTAPTTTKPAEHLDGNTPQTGNVTATAAQMTEIAGYKVSDSDAKAIVKGFATAGNGLGDPQTLEARREIVLTQIFAKDGKSSMVVYNFSDKKYYVVANELIDAYLVDESFRKLGAPTQNIATIKVSGSTTEGKIKSGQYTAQVYETGVLLIDGDNIKMHIGAVEKVNGGVVIHPIINDQDLIVKTEGEMKRFEGIDGELHPLKEVTFSRVSGGYRLYANYRSACVYLELASDYSVKAQLVHAAKNYSGTTPKILPMECIKVDHMICDGEEPVEPEALEYFKTVKPDGTADDIIARFRTAYEELYKTGYVPGYRCSKIKMWTYMVLDLRFGDGTTGFDEKGSGGRERITCLVYNPVKDKVYPVSGAFFTNWKEDSGIGRSMLGYPEGAVQYNVTIGGKKFSEIQIFQNGYIYRTDKGNYTSVAGSAVDSESGKFTASATPMVPDRYGKEIKRVEKDGNVYINYEKGAISCKLSYNKAQFHYSFHSGRNFNLDSGNFELSLLPLDKLVDLSTLACEGTMPTRNGSQVSFNDVIKPKLIAKYTELYNNGFFCGFPEEVFKGAWNNVYAQQFVVGDSKSMIFGEERPYVAALVYNPKTDTVYLMRDDVIKTWQSVYATAGSPTSDEYQVPGCDMWFQTFDFGMTMRKGNLIVFTEEFSSPEAYVQEMQSKPLTAPTHGKDTAKGYIA